jgi:hypothetical protein
MLRTERSAKPEVNSEPQNTLGLSRHQAPSAVMVDGVQSARIDPETTNTRSETSHVREKDYEALKEQLASSLSALSRRSARKWRVCTRRSFA